MKRITALVLTVLMMCSVLTLFASAKVYYFPMLTETPTVVYAWELTYEEGTSLHCMIRNSAEIVKLQQDIKKADGIARWSESEPVYFALQHSSAASSSLRIRQYASIGFLAAKHRKPK